MGMRGMPDRSKPELVNIEAIWRRADLQYRSELADLLMLFFCALHT
jgi:hypothetical protein